MTNVVGIKNTWQECGWVLFAVTLALVPDFAFAAAVQSPMGDVMCAAADMILGKPGLAVGTIAVAAIGMAAALGKVSWGMALITCAGLGALYGTAGLIANLGAAAAVPGWPAGIEC